MPISHRPIEEQKKESISFYLTDPVYSFEDIILAENVKDEIDNALAAEKYKELIYDKWNLGTVIRQKKGMSVNLYGPSGTGKTMVAHAIAKEIGLKLLVVNYAEIESKYVGETSKNIIKMFEFAKESGALILFDEADALLSKRVTMMHNATDVSVNQTRNVLLKILDTYDRPIIFTTNFIQNYDNAFHRRISYQIKMDYPDEACRKLLWNHYLLESLPFSEERSSVIEEVSKYENMTGAEIANIILNSAIECAREKIKGISVKGLEKKIHELIALKDSAEEFTVEIRKITKQEAERG